MRYAITESTARSEASRSGARGICPECREPVVAKVGAVVAPHWAHMADTNCESSRDPETPWHRSVKDALAPPECQEVVFFATGQDGSRTVARRADVCSGDTVVEVQRSPISVNEVTARTEFYRKSGMNVVWVFHWSLMFGSRGRMAFMDQIKSAVPTCAVIVAKDNLDAECAWWRWVRLAKCEWIGDASKLLERVGNVIRAEEARDAARKKQSDEWLAAADARRLAESERRTASINESMSTIRAIMEARDDWAWWGMNPDRAHRFADFLDSASSWIKNRGQYPRELTQKQRMFLASIHQETMQRWPRAKAMAPK